MTQTTEYFANGQVRIKKWFNERGQLHHLHGPAEIEYSQDGTVIKRSYYLYGHQVPLEFHVRLRAEFYYRDLAIANFGRGARLTDQVGGDNENRCNQGP